MPVAISGRQDAALYGSQDGCRYRFVVPNAYVESNGGFPWTWSGLSEESIFPAFVAHFVAHFVGSLSNGSSRQSGRQSVRRRHRQIVWFMVPMRSKNRMGASHEPALRHLLIPSLDIGHLAAKASRLMQSSGLVKPLMAGLSFALVLYIGGFALDQHLRTRRGPWRVTFTHETNGSPAIVVDQPELGITNVKIVFPGESATNISATVAFDVPQKPALFGSVKFEDLTYLPGTVTFDFFGHEVEIIPRTLYLNRRPRPWASNTTLFLRPEDIPSPSPVPDAEQRRY